MKHKQTSTIFLFLSKININFFWLQGDKIKADLSGNKALAIHLSEWAFGERGQLRVRRVQHHREGENQSSTTYTITETVVSTHQWLARGDAWPILFLKFIEREKVNFCSL